MTAQASGQSTLAGKVDWLFTNILKSDGQEYTYQEVAEGVSARLPTGMGVGHTWIWKLRKGQVMEPSYLKLRALAEFFSVPMTFFYEDDPTQADLEAIKTDAAKEADVEMIAQRARRTADKMDPAGRKTLMQIIAALETQYDDSQEQQADNPG